MQKECGGLGFSGAEKNREIWPCARFIGLTGTTSETRGHPSPGTGVPFRRPPSVYRWVTTGDGGKY